jgi:ferredoxin-NADP reductase
MKIIDIFDEIEEAKTYRFISAENEPIFKYTPGQAAKLYFNTPTKKNDFRLYSIATSPLRTDYLELTIKSEGEILPHIFWHKQELEMYMLLRGHLADFCQNP